MGIQKSASYRFLNTLRLHGYVEQDQHNNYILTDKVSKMGNGIVPRMEFRHIVSRFLDELAKLATHYGFIDGGRMVREMSAAELEAACRKCMRLEVTDTRALARALDELGAEYRILSEDTADVYERLNVSKLAAALQKEGCELVSVKERDESLESFYISIVGGAHHV